MELDPGSVAAKGWLAIALVSRMFDAMADSPAADVARAEDLARQAVAAAPRSPLAHFAKGWCYAPKAETQRPSRNTKP